jgi:hypothetical protein
MMKAIFSSTTLVSFHDVSKGPPLPTKKPCQVSIPSILSNMLSGSDPTLPPHPYPLPRSGGEGVLISRSRVPFLCPSVVSTRERRSKIEEFTTETQRHRGEE